MVCFLVFVALNILVFGGITLAAAHRAGSGSWREQRHAFRPSAGFSPARPVDIGGPSIVARQAIVVHVVHHR